MQQHRLILIYFLLLSKLSFAQVSSSEAAFMEYFQLLKTREADTVIIYRQGCTGCERKYDSSSGSVAKGEIIYVLTGHNGISEIATFDQGSNTLDTVDAAPVFRRTVKNRKTLYTKMPAPPVNRKLPFMFEIVEVHLPGARFRQEFYFDADHKMENATAETKKQYKAVQEIAGLLLRCLPVRPIE